MILASPTHLQCLRPHLLLITSKRYQALNGLSGLHKIRILNRSLGDLDVILMIHAFKTLASNL